MHCVYQAITAFAFLLISSCFSSPRTEIVRATAAEEPATRTLTTANTDLRITEIMYNPLPAGNNARSEYEFVELQNSGTEPLDLTGLQFTSGVEYTFPTGTLLQPGGFAILAKSASHFAERYGFAPFGEYGGKLSNQGELLTLSDSNHNPLATVEYGVADPWPAEADGCGLSLVATKEGETANGPTAWRRSAYVGGSPNSVDPALPKEIVPVFINEVLAHTDLPQVDTVEIYNPTQFTALLNGWHLVDDQKTGRSTLLTPCALVPPNDYLLIEEGDLDFSLSALGQTLSLESPDFVESGSTNIPPKNNLGYRHLIHFGASENGQSFGRYITSTGDEHFPPQAALTLGKPNSGPLVGPIVISEIMYNPPAVDGHPGDEYIELTNIGSAVAPLYDPEFPLNRWRLTGIGEFVFAADMSIPPAGTLLVVAIAPDLFRSRYNIPERVQIVGPYSGKLSNSGDTIRLLRPDRQNSDGSVPYILADEVEYADGSPWPTAPDGNGPALRRRTLSAYGNDVANWHSVNTGDLRFVYLPAIRSSLVQQ